MSKRDQKDREPCPRRRASSAACRPTTRCCPGRRRRCADRGALFLALLVLGALPLYLAANAAGLIGDAPAALAKGSNSGPGGGDDDDDSSGPGGRRRRR